MMGGALCGDFCYSAVDINFDLIGKFADCSMTVEILNFMLLGCNFFSSAIIRTLESF